MASLAATNWPKPLVLVPCLSWSTAAAVFTQGIMSQSINWDMLETQYFANGNYRERLAKMVTIVDASFLAGKSFVKNFREKMTNLDQDVQKTHDDQEECSRTNSLNRNVPNGNSRIIEIYRQIEQLNREPLQENDADKTNNEIIIAKSNEPIDIERVNWWEREVLQFMRGIMDECTHLKNFSIPFDTSLITAICAKDDAYVPREGCSSLEDIWPGSKVKYLDAGHVSAYVLYQKIIRRVYGKKMTAYALQVVTYIRFFPRSSIIEQFEKAKEKFDKYRDTKMPEITIETLRHQRQDFIDTQKKKTVHSQSKPILLHSPANDVSSTDKVPSSVQ